MKKKTIAIWSAAVMAVVMAGCSSKAAIETSAPASTEIKEEVKPEAKKNPEIVIAGGDGAGLIAAIQAVKEGAAPSSILIVEKSGELGADISSKENYVNAADTDEQYDNGIEDSFEKFLADIKTAGKEKNNQDLAEMMAESGEETVSWLRNFGIEMEGVTKNEGSSVARSYEASGDKKLSEALSEALLAKVKELKIPVALNTEVKSIAFGKDGEVTGITLADKEGEKNLPCLSVVISDKELLPVLKDSSIKFTKDTADKVTGVIVNSCAEVQTDKEESVPGLYAIGTAISPAVHGEKALSGNEMTAMILFGSTAGTEADIYAEDHK